MKRLFCVVIVALVVAAAGVVWWRVSSGMHRVPLAGNLLANPGFEDGREPWFAMTTAVWVPEFEVTDEAARQGDAGVRLRLGPGADDQTTRIWGVSQRVNPESFPTRLSGWFRVNDWVRGAEHQYVQAVVIVEGPAPGREDPNHQVRFLLGGVDEQPFDMVNVCYRGVGTPLPEPGVWTYFEFDPAAEFARCWQRVPNDYEWIQVFFEARYDHRNDVEAALRGVVVFDDLYFGK